MRPIDIDILMHYYITNVKHSQLGNAEHRKSHEAFVGMGMLERVGPPCPPPGEPEKSEFRLTNKGKVYIEALMAVPVPVTMYVVKWPGEPQIFEVKP